MTGANSSSLVCPACGAAAELTTGVIVYPHRPDLHHRRFWRCPAGHSHVGCHSGTSVPLGCLATGSTRAARHRAHEAFDPLWSGRERRFLTRTEAYEWLARSLGIPSEECHIGRFDDKTCEQVEVLCMRHLGAEQGGKP